MLPLAIAGIGAGIGALTGLGESIFGGIKASNADKKMADLEANRPIYSRPDEIKQYLEMAKTGANSQMPGSTQLAQNTQQSTQSMISKLEDTGQLDAGTLQQLYQSEIGAHNSLAMQQGQYHQSQLDRLSQALGESAKYADQEFEYNVNAPWQRQYNRAIGQYEAGQKMLGQGISGVASAGMNFANMVGGIGGQPSTGSGYSYAMPPTGGSMMGNYKLPGLIQSSQLNTSGMLATPGY